MAEQQHDDFDLLLERSSLGAPEVRRARSRVPWTAMADVHNRLVVVPGTGADGKATLAARLAADICKGVQAKRDARAGDGERTAGQQMYAVVLDVCPSSRPREDSTPDAVCHGQVVQGAVGSAVEHIVRREWMRRWAASPEQTRLIVYYSAHGTSAAQWFVEGLPGCLSCDKPSDAKQRD